MKEAFFSGGGFLIAVLSTTTILLPMAAIIIRKKMWHKAFAALVAYYAQFFIFSLFTNGFVTVSEEVMEWVKFSHIFIDLPLVLLFMQFFTDKARTRNMIRWTLGAWLGLALLLIATIGLKDQIIPYLMGPGLVMAGLISMVFFLKYMKAGIHHRWETGKAFMAGSLVFLYGSYLLIYFIQFVMKWADNEEVYLLFQLTNILSAVLMTIGLVLNRKRPVNAKADDKERDRKIILTNWSDFQLK